MKSHTLNTLYSIARCQRFIDRYVPALSDIDLSPARIALALAVADIERGLLNRRIALAMIGVVADRVTELRYTIVGFGFRLIKNITRYSFRHDPEVSAIDFPRPDSSIGRLILSAHIVADVVGRNHHAFVTAGLAPNMPDRLRGYAQYLRMAQYDKVTYKGWRAEDQEALEEAGRRGRQAIDALDAMLKTHFRSRPERYTRWLEAKRIVPLSEAPCVLWKRRRRRKAS